MAKKIVKKTKKTTVKKASNKKIVKKKAVEKTPKTLEDALKLGQKIPNFVLQSTAGEFSLEKLRGKKIVLYFYPKDATPGCTIEGHEFTQLKAQFQKLNTEVFGLSRDSLQSHQNFKNKQNYKIDLISDPQETACKIFDVIQMKNMYGKKVLGLVRSTFLINEKGELIKIWRGVKAEGHAEQVLQEIKQL